MIPVPDTFGTDFEFGLRDPKLNQIIPAPLVFSKLELGESFEEMQGTYHPDGAQCELSSRIYVINCGKLKRLLSNEVRADWRMQHGLEPVFEDVIEYDSTLLDYDPNNHRVGCKPWVNVFTGKDSMPSTYPDNFRYQAGHIHLGWWKTDKQTQPVEDYPAIVKSIEMELAPIRVGDNPQRNLLYGASGSIRLKEYGVEVRAPSNRWVPFHSPASLAKLITRAVEQAEKRKKLIPDLEWMGIWDTVDQRELKALIKILKLEA